jgi:hypothetical protein
MATIDQMIADLDRQIAGLTTARNALAEAHGVRAEVSTKGRRKFTAAQKKQQSKNKKAWWAAKKSGELKTKGTSRKKAAAIEPKA